MSKKPVILIAWGPCLDLQFYAQGMMLTKAYEWAVAGNGGIPLMPLDRSCIEDYAERCDGLIFPGAMNFKPLPGIPQEKIIEGHARRDEFQKALFDAFKAKGKPIMGICEGHQKVNCCLNGSILLDLAESSGVGHFNTAHTVKTKKGSLIEKIWGDDFYINSYHNYYVDRLGDDLEITAVSPQGNVEAVEHKSLPIFGFQFHPERMRGDDKIPAEAPEADPLFRWFIDLCGQIRDGKPYVKDACK
jgi:putative glutamine amidotransferase